MTSTPSSKRTLRIGTRHSPLALWQAKHVQHTLHQHYPDLESLLVPVSTLGDTDKTSPLSTLGGKGVFVRGLEEALANHSIDIAVHSLKDVTSQTLETLDFFAFLTPESIQDALVLPDTTAFLDPHNPLASLPKGSRIGTGSLRRVALLKHLRPDIVTHPIRGNIETRMQKVCSGELDGILLSEAGLKRMGTLPTLHYAALPCNSFVPAPGQGVIVVQGRKSDNATWGQLLTPLIDETQRTISLAQLCLLQTLGFNCEDPFGIWSYTQETMLHHTLFWEKESQGHYFSCATHTHPSVADWRQVLTRLGPEEMAHMWR